MICHIRRTLFITNHSVFMIDTLNRNVDPFSMFFITHQHPDAVSEVRVNPSPRHID